MLANIQSRRVQAENLELFAERLELAVDQHRPFPRRETRADGFQSLVDRSATQTRLVRVFLREHAAVAHFVHGLREPFPEHAEQQTIRLMRVAFTQLLDVLRDMQIFP